MHRFALYLDVAGRVLPVLTSDAVPLPTALRLAEPSGAVSWGVGRGRRGARRRGAGDPPGLDVVAARTWRPARVRAAAVAVGCSGGHAEVGHLTRPGASERDGRRGGWLADGIRARCLRPRVLRWSPGQPPEHPTRAGDAVAGLVGRGPGLTPSGDDALAGALLVAYALGTGTALADAVRAPPRCHDRGVRRPARRRRRRLRRARPWSPSSTPPSADDPDAVARALPAVLAIGHTSGADLVTGIRAAWRPWPLSRVLNWSPGRHSAPTRMTGRSAA